MKKKSKSQRAAASTPPHLKYYMFDWDDNILHMPTRIHLEKKTPHGWRRHDVTTAEFARIRRDTVNFRPLGGDWDRAFVDFYDIGHRGKRAFLLDTKAALAPVIKGRQRGAPSFLKFKKALIEGRLFAIITARSHGAASIRKGVEYFIDKVLTQKEKDTMFDNLRNYISHFGGIHARVTNKSMLKKYLDMNRYHGVTSPDFQKVMGRKLGGSESPETAKQFAIKDFVAHIVGMIQFKGLGMPISVGFSDDDPHNIKAVEQFLRKELAREHPGIRFVVYDTSDPTIPKGRKIVIRGGR